MSEEEKKAIHLLQSYAGMTHKLTDNQDRPKLDQAIEKVLNLIEKQSKEIETLKNNNKDLLRKLRNRVKEVKKLEKYSLYKKEFSTLNKQIEKKDKIINEMGEHIEKGCDFDSTIQTKQEVIEYFTKKVDDIDGRN